MCPPGRLKPGRHPAKFVVLLQKKYAVTVTCQHVGRGQATQPATDNDNVVLVLNTLKEIFGHLKGTAIA